MPSTFTPRHRLEKQAYDENPETWGAVLGTVLDLVEEAMDGVIDIDCAGASDVILTASNGVSDQSRQRVFRLTGALTGNISVIVPAQERFFVVRNATSGAFTITFKPAGGTGVALPQASVISILYTDGSTMYSVTMGVNPTTGHPNQILINRTDLTLPWRISTSAAYGGSGPIYQTRREAVGVDNAFHGDWAAVAWNDASEEIVFSQIKHRIVDASNGTEDGAIEFPIIRGGVETTPFIIHPNGLKAPLAAVEYLDANSNPIRALSNTAFATVAATGTEVNWSSGIRADATRLSLLFRNVEVASTANLIVQLGVSGGLVTSGYRQTTGENTGFLDITGAGAASTFPLALDIPSGATVDGYIDLMRMAGTDIWLLKGMAHRPGGPAIWNAGGSVDLGGTLTQIEFRPSGGIAFAGSGTVNLHAE